MKPASTIQLESNSKESHVTTLSKNLGDFHLASEKENSWLKIYDSISAALKSADDGSLLEDNSLTQYNNIFLERIKSIKEEDYNKKGSLIFSKVQISQMKQRAIETLEVLNIKTLEPAKIYDDMLNQTIRHDSQLFEYVNKTFPKSKNFRFQKYNFTQRTSVLACTYDGSNATFIGLHNKKESSDKTAGEKNYKEALLGIGTYKKVKRAVDLLSFANSGNIHANLAKASIVLDAGSFKNIISEIQILCKNFVGSENIVVPIYFSMPFCREKNGKQEVLMYAFYNIAEGSLVNFLRKPQLFVTPEQNLELNNFWNEKITEIPQVLKSLMIDIARGIKEIHDKDFVHQDIKPENILLFRDSNGNLRAKITDFGLASRHQSPKVASYSLYVAAPELFAINNSEDDEYYVKTEGIYYGRELYRDTNNEKFFEEISRNPDKKSDIWAMGITFYLLLTRCKAYFSKESFLSIHAHILGLKEKYVFLNKTIEISTKDRANIQTALELLCECFYPAVDNETKKMKI